MAYLFGSIYSRGLYNLGVYAKFDIAKVEVTYTKYWILNPYLSFGGKLVESDIANLFIGTQLTNEYYRRASQIAKPNLPKPLRTKDSEN